MDENGAPPRKPNRGQFQKGQSGNPGGRKPIPADLKEAMRGLSMKATKVLQKAMDESLVKGQPSTRTGILAALAVHDRGYGKPAQTINAKVEGVDLSAAHLEALRGLGAVTAAGDGDEPDSVTH